MTQMDPHEEAAFQAWLQLIVEMAAIPMTPEQIQDRLVQAAQFSAETVQSVRDGWLEDTVGHC